MTNENWHLTLHPAYCDYIANLIAKNLKGLDGNKLIDTVGRVRFDFDKDGSMLSTTKRISIVDSNGKAYTITISENANQHSV